MTWKQIFIRANASNAELHANSDVYIKGRNLGEIYNTSDWVIGRGIGYWDTDQLIL